MKTLITGGNGFVGSALAQKLIERGEEVRITIRQKSTTRNIDGLEVEKVCADVRDEQAIAKALKGCRKLYHTAALYKVWLRDEQELHDVNVEGTEIVMREALRQGVEKVVLTSSIAALGITENGNPSDESVRFNLWDTTLPYEVSKYKSEEAAWKLVKDGLPLVVVRPSLVLGERDFYPTPSGKLVLDVLHGRYLFYLDGGINLVDINDVIAGHCAAMDRGKIGESYNLGNNSNNISLKELFSAIAEVGGVAAPRFKIPYGAAQAYANLSLLMANHVTHKPPLLAPGALQVLHLFKKMDSKKAIKELGLPQTPLRETIRRTVDWYRENGYWGKTRIR
jgi:dihydroflavonol-4-reductase